MNIRTIRNNTVGENTALSPRLIPPGQCRPCASPIWTVQWEEDTRRTSGRHHPVIIKMRIIPRFTVNQSDPRWRQDRQAYLAIPARRHKSSLFVNDGVHLVLGELLLPDVSGGGPMAGTTKHLVFRHFSNLEVIRTC